MWDSSAGDHERKHLMTVYQGTDIPFHIFLD